MGSQCYLFYNAKDQKDKAAGPWTEQTGFATSTDLVRWRRFQGNPVLKAGNKGAFDDRFASDPVVMRHQDKWLMYHFYCAVAPAGDRQLGEIEHNEVRGIALATR